MAYGTDGGTQWALAEQRSNKMSTQTADVLAQMGIATGGVAADPRQQTSGLVPAARITGKMLSYDQICDALLLSPPGETQGALARKLGYSQSWLSRIIASDAFQAKLAQRIEKDIEPERRETMRLRFASIEEEARGILLASLNKLAARLEDPAGVPDDLVVKSASMTSKLLGYGARQEPTHPPVNLHFHLEQLAQNVRNLNKAPSAVIEGTSTPVPTGGCRTPNDASGEVK